MLAKRKEEFELYQEVPVVKSFEIPKPKLNTNLRAKCFILVVLISIMAMFTIIRSAENVSRGYELVSIKAQADKLEGSNEQLKVDIAYMKSPQRIKQIATQNLGMIVPKEVYFASQNTQ